MMAIPRPKILSVVTVPTAGWNFDFTVSDGGSLNTPLSVTVPAGDYFVAFDADSDDLLWVLTDLMRDAILNTAGIGSAKMTIGLNSDNKVIFNFAASHYTGNPGRDVKLRWTSTDTDLSKALGFDSSADDTSTGTDNPVFTADWQHTHGWYADEDGQLGSLTIEDINVATTSTVTTLTGVTATQLRGSRYRSKLDLQWLDRDLTFSDGIDYGTAIEHPYTRNKALECWWHEARQGNRFRVYREGRNNADVWVQRGLVTAKAADSLTDANRTADTDPQTHKDRIFRCFGGDGDVGRFRITSHTATVYSAAGTQQAGNWAGVGSVYFILDQRYQTYVVDLSAMTGFAPREIPQVDRYNISIPLLRYVA